MEGNPLLAPESQNLARPQPSAPVVTPPFFAAQLNAREPSLVEYWHVLHKRRWTILITFLSVMALTIGYTMRQTRLYKAVGRVAIYDPSSQNLVGFKNPESNPAVASQDDYTVTMATQVRVLQGDNLALRVVQKLHLLQGTQKNGVPGQAPTPEEESAAIGRFKSGLKVAIIPNTRLIEVQYESPDPRMAADMVNTIMSSYIELNMKTKFDSTTQAAEWLSKQLVDLQTKVQVSEQKLVDYEKQHGIVGIDEKQNIITSKLDELNKEVTAAEADRIEKQARYSVASGPNPENLATGTLFDKLRAEKSDLDVQVHKAQLQYGPSHPKLIELQTHLRDVDNQIATEKAKALL